MVEGKIGKSNRINRMRQESELHVSREKLSDGPEWLDPVARAEYDRVVYEASQLPLYDNLDYSVLALYAAAYSQYITAYTHLRDDGYVVWRKEGEAVSPWVGIADKAAGQIFKASTKLGLAVTDRLKLIVPTREEAAPNKFLTLLKKA